MNRRLLFPVAMVVLVALPAVAQRREERGQNPPRANQGRVPPPPPRRDNPRSKPEPERYDRSRVNSTPHVNQAHWYGRDRPDDKRYRVDRPFEHGRFEHFGPSYRYRIERFDRDHHRFWLPGGFFFEVAAVFDFSIIPLQPQELPHNPSVQPFPG